MWIRTHLEEDQDVSMPKHEVYDEYQSVSDPHLSVGVSWVGVAVGALRPWTDGTIGVSGPWVGLLLVFVRVIGRFYSFSSR